MAAVPKKKPSKTRQRSRHSAWKAEFSAVDTVKCTNCGESRLAHRVCANCGYYKGVLVVESKTKVKKVSRKAETQP